jgi:uncharacterized protein YbaR (Trm112 family)
VHIVLTDILTCPVCDAEHGLVVRTDRMSGRDVREGSLGCPNCRRQFPIRDGVAWLVPDARARVAEPRDQAPPEEAIRVAALLGLDEAKGFVLLAGPVARHAAEVAALTAAALVVAADTEAIPPSGDRVSRIVLGGSLPFAAGRLHGIWLAGSFADAHLEAATRALHPAARLVLDPAPDDAGPRLPAGLRVIARQGATVVCAGNP